jgi:hypothetical protein
MVIIKLNLIENCFLLTLNESVMSSKGDKGILRYKNPHPSMLVIGNLSINYIVFQTPHHQTSTITTPAHYEDQGSERSITGQFFLTLSSWGGNSFGLIELRKSRGVIIVWVIINWVMAIIHIFFAWKYVNHLSIQPINMLIPCR